MHVIIDFLSVLICVFFVYWFDFFDLLSNPENVNNMGTIKKYTILNNFKESKMLYIVNGYVSKLFELKVHLL